MTRAATDQCLALLREADALLIEEGELALAAHLSLVIELLARRFPTPSLLAYS